MKKTKNELIKKFLFLTQECKNIVINKQIKIEKNKKLFINQSLIKYQNIEKENIIESCEIRIEEINSNQNKTLETNEYNYNTIHFFIYIISSSL